MMIMIMMISNWLYRRVDNILKICSMIKIADKSAFPINFKLFYILIK